MCLFVTLAYLRLLIRSSRWARFHICNEELPDATIIPFTIGKREKDSLSLVSDRHPIFPFSFQSVVARAARTGVKDGVTNGRKKMNNQPN